MVSCGVSGTVDSRDYIGGPVPKYNQLASTHIQRKSELVLVQRAADQDSTSVPLGLGKFSNHNMLINRYILQNYESANRERVSKSICPR